MVGLDDTAPVPISPDKKKAESNSKKMFDGLDYVRKVLIERYDKKLKESNYYSTDTDFEILIQLKMAITHTTLVKEEISDVISIDDRMDNLEEKLNEEMMKKHPQFGI